MQPTHPIDRALALLCALAREIPAVELERQASQVEFFPAGALPDLEPARSQAELRHFEWFLFERPSDALGDLPAFALESALLEHAEAPSETTSNALRYSRAGVFRVANVEAGQGLWLEDLASRGSLPIAESEASYDLQVDDLLAGRLYPMGDEQYRLSPAMAVFRDSRLAEALEADLERVRGSRRGTLRIAQRELERMFFVPGGSRAAAEVLRNPPPLDLALELPPEPVASRAELLADARRVRAELERFLNDGAGSGAEGLGPERSAELLTSLEQEAARGERSSAARAMGELLDRVAFESDLDLDVARRQCLEYWNCLASLVALPPDPTLLSPNAAAPAAERARAKPAEPAAPEAPAKPKRPAGGLSAFQRFARTGGPDAAGTDTPAVPSAPKPGSPAAQAGASPGADKGAAQKRPAADLGPPVRDGVDRSSAAKALSAFDAGRARGEDLDALFGQLERDLGLDSEGEEDSATLPDFPGVVGALVQEYLWERRAEGASGEADLDGPLLEEFAQSAQELGLCEELDGLRLARFATAAAFAGDGQSNHDPLPTLERFARWIESQHGHPLWTDFSASAAALLKHLPRLASAERLLRAQGLVGGPSAQEELLQTSLEHGDSLGIRDEEGRFVRLKLAPELAACLLPGDRVRLRWSRGEPQIVALVAPLPEALPDGPAESEEN